MDNILHLKDRYVIYYGNGSDFKTFENGFVKLCRNETSNLKLSMPWVNPAAKSDPEEPANMPRSSNCGITARKSTGEELNKGLRLNPWS